MEISLQIPSGYQFIEKTQTVDSETACRLLHSRFHRRCTNARLDGNQIQILRHVIRCPHCGKETPAYAPFKKSTSLIWLKSEHPEKITYDRLWSWLGLQYSLFSQKDTVLSIQEPELSKSPFTCPKCGQVSQFSQEQVALTITDHQDNICIHRPILHLGQLMEIKWAHKLTGLFRFPMTETLCFDLTQGQTRLVLTDNQGAQLYTKQIKTVKSVEDSTKLLEHLQNNTVKRTLGRMFATRWRGSFIYAYHELTLQHFMDMTRFPGYPRHFYAAIPYDKKTGLIEDSFRQMAQKIRHPENSLSLLPDFKLPQAKSLRKRFADTPGLLFYLEECGILYRLLRDINLLCQVLDAKNVFTILSTLHTYPGLLKFYQDYYMAKGGILLCRHLIDHEDLVNSKAMEYAVSSSVKRAQEQKKWSEKSYFLRNPTIFEVDHVFSVPMSTQADHSRNCRIDHYSFRRLCTSMDFEVAGTALNNCLINWKPENNPVTVVCRQNRILAAIEVEDNRVIQALGENNQGIDPHDPLYTAIEKWCKRFQISLGVNNE